jgi:hypothetical protein
VALAILTRLQTLTAAAGVHIKPDPNAFPGCRSPKSCPAPRRAGCGVWAVGHRPCRHFANSFELKQGHELATPASSREQKSRGGRRLKVIAG